MHMQQQQQLLLSPMKEQKNERFVVDCKSSHVLPLSKDSTKNVGIAWNLTKKKDSKLLEKNSKKVQ